MADFSSYAYHIGCILKALVYIEEHLNEDLPLEKIAKIANISPFYFHRLFRIYLGKTVAEYTKELRLRKAAGLLQYSDASITEIAFEAGYETPSSFTKVFNQVMGQSPRQYRKRMQPLVQAILKRTQSNQKENLMIKAVYITRKNEPILFVRRIGDYQETPWQAFTSLIQFLHEEKIAKESILSYYSIALDDPSIVKRSECRFDACVSLRINTPPKGEVGQKVLHGGRYAVFTHKGSYQGLEKTFDEIFRIWYPSCKEELFDYPPFCEHLDYGNPQVTEENQITKLYIPLKNKS